MNLFLQVTILIKIPHKYLKLNDLTILYNLILPLIFFSGTSGNGGVRGLLSGVVKLLVFSFSFLAISMFSLCCFAFICTTQTASDLTTVLHSTHVSCPDSLYVNCLLRKISIVQIIIC